MRATSSDLEQRVRNLAEIRMDEQVVVSAYISLDPSEFATPRDREAQIESLSDRARAEAAELELSHDARRALDEGIDQVRRWAASSLDAAGAHGIAVFCCSPAAVFDVFRLSASVGPEIHLDTTAYLEPLMSVLPSEKWCVFLVNRRASRILRGSARRLFEVDNLEDDVHRKHDQGGWSQARYQRSVEKEVSDHVQNACDRLFDSFGRLSFHNLLVGCPEELWPEVEGKLHSYLRERVIERFDAEVEHEGPDHVLARVQPLMERYERREESDLIERLAEQLGRNERAASGLAPVLEALNANRVAILLVATGFSAAGVTCPQCGWLGSQGRECPADGTRLYDVSNVVEKAVEKAVLQSASLHHVRYHEPERALGGPMAALLRF